jgi:hypothetical protein
MGMSDGIPGIGSAPKGAAKRRTNKESTTCIDQIPGW